MGLFVAGSPENTRSRPLLLVWVGQLQPAMPFNLTQQILTRRSLILAEQVLALSMSKFGCSAAGFSTIWRRLLRASWKPEALHHHCCAMEGRNFGIVLSEVHYSILRRSAKSLSLEFRSHNPSSLLPLILTLAFNILYIWFICCGLSGEHAFSPPSPRVGGPTTTCDAL